jgi:hypothetical protein
MARLFPVPRTIISFLYLNIKTLHPNIKKAAKIHALDQHVTAQLVDGILRLLCSNSVSWSQDAATGPCPEPDKSVMSRCMRKCSHLRLDFPSGLCYLRL